MKQIVAIPTSNGMLDTHFGHCKVLTLFEMVDGNITEKKEVNTPPHEPGLLPKFCHELGVTDIISGGIGAKAIELFKINDINVFTGAPVQRVDEIIQSFISKTLELNVNLCDH